MENNTQFKITYYSNKDKKHITRQGKWDEKCRYWTSKMGAKLRDSLHVFGARVQNQAFPFEIA